MDNFAQAIGKLMLIYETKISNARFRKDIENELAFTLKRQALIEVISEANEISRIDENIDARRVNLYVRNVF